MHWRSFTTMLVILGLVAGCGNWLGEGGGGPAPQIQTSDQSQTLPLSLHGTANGMQQWYEQPDGFGAISGVPYASSGCGDCHVAPTGCDQCHESPSGGAVVEPEKCLNCHGRIDKENVLQLSDLHMTEKGMVCSDCHNPSEMHGTGTTPDGMFADGGLSTKCVDCHTELPDNAEHSVHGTQFNCDACHMASAITCYNCHFQTLLDSGEKKAAATFKDFIILLNGPDGKVRAGSYQSVVYQDKMFVAFGPYHAHTITAQGRTCGDCHGSARMTELRDTGKIKMTWWDAGKSEIQHTTGVIPFVPDKMDFQFVTLGTDGKWEPLDSATSTLEYDYQYQYCEPLNNDQLAALGAASGGTSPVSTLGTSLHGTANGMRWWYEQADGFGPYSGVDYETAGCGECHTKTNGCDDCHADAAAQQPPVQPDKCKNCHGRIDKENVLQLSDLHIDEQGMVCSDCHTMTEIHGTGAENPPDSMFAEGGLTVKCQDCHTTIPDNAAHKRHGDQFNCDSCHMASAITCYNCHFQTLLDSGEKKAAATFKDFIILMNGPDGKVRPGSYQSVYYDNKGFVAFGPYHAHTVMRKGRDCTDCHANERMQELNDTGSIQMTWWDAGAGELQHTTGVIPFVPDKMDFQFVDVDGNGWTPVDPAEQQKQNEFCTPLSDYQLKVLSNLPPELTLPNSLHGTANGMRWWYEQPNGFGALSGVDYDSTGCAECHAQTTTCSDCHFNEDGTGGINQPDGCKACHGRIGAENVLQLNDLHMTDKGMVCSDCHSYKEAHGTGADTPPDSMFAEGGLTTQCTDCHTELPDNPEHSRHGTQFDCDACHVQSVITCYNCHFQTLLDSGEKKAAATFKDFVILMNGPDGKVRTGSYQAVVYQDKTFVAFGPYHAHTITAQGRTCLDCHSSDRIKELNDTGHIAMTWWDSDAGEVKHATGVIPFVPDKFTWQFLDLDQDGNWQQSTTDLTQYQNEFCTPLTQDQLTALGVSN